MKPAERRALNLQYPLSEKDRRDSDMGLMNLMFDGNLPDRCEECKTLELENNESKNEICGACARERKRRTFEKAKAETRRIQRWEKANRFERTRMRAAGEADTGFSKERN